MSSGSSIEGSILFLDVDEFWVEMFYDSTQDWVRRVKFDKKLDLSAAHACVVVEDAYISEDISNDRLMEYFMLGGTVVILAVHGIFAVPAVLNDIFGTRWRFASYTKDDYVVTPRTRALFSDRICSLKFPYCKANRLAVPDGEALLLPYFRPRDDPNYDSASDDDGDFGCHCAPRDTPVAIHVGPSGGRVAYFGCCNAEKEFVAMFRELCSTSKLPRFEATHSYQEEAEGTRSGKADHAASLGSNFDDRGEEHGSSSDRRFLSEENVWRWFKILKDDFPGQLIQDDHPYNGDRKQHAYGTKLQDRQGSACKILGSSLRTPSGGSPRVVRSSYVKHEPLIAMYKVQFEGDCNVMYLDFDRAHGRRAQFKPVELAHVQRIENQQKALRASHQAMEALLSTLSKTEAKVEAMEQKTATASQPMLRQCSTPSYWTECTRLEDGSCFVPILDDITWFALQDCLCTQDPDWLGKGRDYAWKTDHTRLCLAQAWRVENPVQYNKYLAEKEKIRMDFQNTGLPFDPKLVSEHLRLASGKLPGALDANINENYLLHGTAPEYVLPIVSEGLNERLSGRPGFGFGCYLAEDAGKANQYVLPDEKFNRHNELHQKLYRGTSTLHPGRGTCYMFLCRASLGLFAHTFDGEKTLGGCQVWDAGTCDSKGKGKGAKRRASQRELAYIPGFRKTRYHSEVVEISDPADAKPNARQALRYREFVIPHGDRIYPEYLLAFYRE